MGEISIVYSVSHSFGQAVQFMFIFMFFFMFYVHVYKIETIV